MAIPAGNRHELRRLIEERLKDSRPPTDPRSAVPAGFSADVDAAVRQYFPPSPAAAAVLVPLVDREDGLTVLLTQRATHLKNHAGQISFPGGRLEASDEGRPVYARMGYRDVGRMTLWERPRDPAHPVYSPYAPPPPPSA